MTAQQVQKKSSSEAKAKPYECLGYDHVKVAVADLPAFETILKAFGFQKQELKSAPSFLEKPDAIYGSGEAFFCLYSSKHPLASKHWNLHGDTLFDLSYLIEDTDPAFYFVETGIGQMRHTLVSQKTFAPVAAPRGILKFDHNTMNLDRGQLDQEVDRYLKDFGFQKGQYFKIFGQKTGLYSWVTRSKNFGVQMPFNEAADEKSQIQEFISMHKGPGVQHLALYSKDIVKTIDAVRSDSSIRFLDLPDTYYEVVQKKVKIKEKFEDLIRLRIQVDQDPSGYLLQIFTQNLIGGFFFELIQREGNQGFGEGNFQALFDAIELDQKRRGVL